jgi:SAM-dependent methyltransferase
LPKTDADDPLAYYYRPVTGPLYRARLTLAGSLLGPGPFAALLEVGNGSGIFLPELARRSKRLAAIDLHTEQKRVGKALRRLGVEVDLRQGTLYDLPFRSAEFDALVCLSVLEHLEDLTGALDEFRRVLQPRGVAVLGFPVRNPVTDAFFRLAGYNPRAIHPSSHSDILDAACRHPAFEIEREAHFPRALPLPLAAYAVLSCRAR